LVRSKAIARMGREAYSMVGTGNAVLGAIFNINHPAHYVHPTSWFQMSVSNIVVIVLMLVVFALAIALPFPGSHDKADTTAPAGAGGSAS
jgi:hypothetical protein